MKEEEIALLGTCDLLDKYEELLCEQARKPKTFRKNKAKEKLLCDIYEEVLLRVMETNAR